MYILYPSEMLVNSYQTLWHHIREESFIQFHSHANSKPQKPLQYLWFSLLRQNWFVWNRNRTFSGQI